MALAGAATFQQHRRYSDPHIVFDRFNLPGFDAYVYLAMAERPGFFTVAPWGYRVLTPWLAHSLPASPVRAFRQLALAGLFLAGVLLYLFLRRLGHGELPSLLALGFFGFSAPAGEMVRHPFLAEPLCIALYAALLLALESGAGAGRLALVLVLGALAKEIFILFLPGVFLALCARQGGRRALATTALAALPALATSLLLRNVWVPGGGVDADLPGLATLAQAARTVGGAFGRWWQPLLLGGLTPLALLGALLPSARPYLARYGYFVALGYALPLAAAVYTGGGEPARFFARDVPRLILYALPVTLPLALLALERLGGRRSEQRASGGSRSVEAAAGTAACALALMPLLVMDPYRRIDLGGRRSGPYVVGLCRGTLRTASRLEAGQAIVWDPGRRFVPGIDHPGQLDRMRWFLWEGWGNEAYFGTGDFAMQQSHASLLVPALQPRDLEATLALVAAREATLELRLNGTAVGELHAGPERRDRLVRLPAPLLFRGDNLLTLVARESPASAGVRLLAVALRPSASGPGGRTSVTPSARHHSTGSRL